MRKCALFSCAGAAGAGCLTGMGTLGGELGALIMQSAGWTVGGAPVVSISMVAAASAAGTAAVTGPVVCCLMGCMAISDDGEDGLSSSQRSSSSVGGTALLGAANGAAGAAMLGMSGTKLGYVVASAAAGLPLAIIGTIVVTGVTACAGQICYKLCCDSQGNLSGMDGQGRSTPILTPGRQRATVSATSALLAVQHDAVVTFPQHPKGLN